MIKVLQMGMTDNLGGIETYLINYYRNIDKKKIQFDFINIYPNKLCFQDEMESLGANIYKVSNYYKHPIKYIKEVKKIIKENNYNIVHCNMNSAAMLYPLIAAKLAGAKVIIAHSHNSSSDKGFVKELLHNINKHFIPFFANEYFACSMVAGKWFFNDKIIKSNEFQIINNAIEINKFKFDKKIREQKRKELNIEDSTLVIGHVGRFVEQKNHRFLIDIFNEVHKQKENSILLLAGQGPLMEEMKEKVKTLGIEASVKFLGQRNDINELYQAMDLFLFPSLYEGLGMVVVEAQVSGLPCLASTEVPSIANVANRLEFLSLDSNVKIWANKIKDTINIKRIECLKEVSSAGYDIKNEVKKLEKKYVELWEKNNEEKN